MHSPKQTWFIVTFLTAKHSFKCDRGVICSASDNEWFLPIMSSRTRCIVTPLYALKTSHVSLLDWLPDGLLHEHSFSATRIRWQLLGWEVAANQKLLEPHPHRRNRLSELFQLPINHNYTGFFLHINPGGGCHHRFSRPPQEMTNQRFFFFVLPTVAVTNLPPPPDLVPGQKPATMFVFTLFVAYVVII